MGCSFVGVRGGRSRDIPTGGMPQNFSENYPEFLDPLWVPSVSTSLLGSTSFYFLEILVAFSVTCILSLVLGGWVGRKGPSSRFVPREWERLSTPVQVDPVLAVDL